MCGWAIGPCLCSEVTLWQSHAVDAVPTLLPSLMKALFLQPFTFLIPTGSVHSVFALPAGWSLAACNTWSHSRLVTFMVGTEKDVGW